MLLFVFSVVNAGVSAQECARIAIKIQIYVFKTYFSVPLRDLFAVRGLFVHDDFCAAIFYKNKTFKSYEI